jgi:hypothetical protein
LVRLLAGAFAAALAEALAAVLAAVLALTLAFVLGGVLVRSFIAALAFVFALAGTLVVRTVLLALATAFARAGLPALALDLATFLTGFAAVPARRDVARPAAVARALGFAAAARLRAGAAFLDAAVGVFFFVLVVAIIASLSSLGLKNQ